MLNVYEYFLILMRRIEAETLKDMTQLVLNYINLNTDCEDLDYKTTKDVAIEFGLTIEKAYVILNKLESDRLIDKLPPANDTKFQYCGWIRREK